MEEHEPRLAGLWIIVATTVLMLGWMVADLSGAFKAAAKPPTITTSVQTTDR